MQSSTLQSLVASLSRRAALHCLVTRCPAHVRGRPRQHFVWTPRFTWFTLQATEQDLWALFAPLGEILELYVLRNNQTGRSRGCAFVTYASRDLAQQVTTSCPLKLAQHSRLCNYMFDWTPSLPAGCRDTAPGASSSEIL